MALIQTIQALILKWSAWEDFGLQLSVYIVGLFNELFPFLHLGETNRPYSSPPLCLELSKKFVVGGGGGVLM